MEKKKIHLQKVYKKERFKKNNFILLSIISVTFIKIILLFVNICQGICFPRKKTHQNVYTDFWSPVDSREKKNQNFESSK